MFAACGGDDGPNPTLSVAIHGPDDGPDSQTIGFPSAVDECVDRLRFRSYRGTTLLSEQVLSWNARGAQLPTVSYETASWFSVEGLNGNLTEACTPYDLDQVVASGASPVFRFSDGDALPRRTNVFTGIPGRFQEAFRFEEPGGEAPEGESVPLRYELPGSERAGHTLTELEDGSGWLVIGGARMGDGDGISGSGITSMVDAIEFYDAYTGDFLTLYEPGCAGGTASECALRLPDGVAFHTATALEDGRVLVVGGLRMSGADALRPTSNAYVIELTGYAEGTLTQVLYDAEAFPADRAFHTATRMADGRVVIIGGIGRTYGPDPTFQADIYEVLPGAELMITDSGVDLANARAMHSATFFAGGGHGIIVVGGRNADGVVGTSEVVFAQSGEFGEVLAVDVLGGSDIALNDLSTPRFGHSAVAYSCPFSDDEYLAIIGGYTEAGATLLDGSGATPTVETYQPGAFTEFGQYEWTVDGGTTQLPGGGRAFGSAVALPYSADIVFAGGIDDDGAPVRAADRLLRDWGNCQLGGTARAVEGSMRSARAFHQLGTLSTGFVLSTGGFDGTSSLNSSEFYHANEYSLVYEYFQ